MLRATLLLAGGWLASAQTTTPITLTLSTTSNAKSATSPSTVGINLGARSRVGATKPLW